MKMGILAVLVILLVVSVGIGWFYMGVCAQEGKSCTLGKCCEGMQCCSDQVCRSNCCYGTLSLTVAPDKALVNDSLNITVFGLNDCGGKNVSVKDNGVVVCTIESGKTGGGCQLNAPSVVGTHVYTAEIDINLDGNLSANEQASKLVTIEDRCSGNITLDVPSAATPGANVTAQIAGLTGCSDRSFSVTVDNTDACTGGISAGTGSCSFTVPAALGNHIVKAYVDLNKDNDTLDAGESAEKVLSASYVCGGTISLSMVDKVAPGTAINATISGISYCDGKRAYVRHGNCSGADAGYCDLSGSSCTISFNAPSTVGTYAYYACLDMNANTVFEAGEQASRSLIVGCVGNLSLSLSPSSAEPNAAVNATVAGITGCSGRIANITLNNSLLCPVNLSTASYCTFNAPNIIGTYAVTAALDMNDNNLTNDTGEYTTVNLSVGTVLHFTETQLTSGGNRLSPKIYNNTIVYDNSTTVYSFAIGGNETAITSGNSSCSFPAIYGNKIVYLNNTDGNYSINMWDGSSTTLISNNATFDSQPVIYENTIIYQIYNITTDVSQIYRYVSGETIVNANDSGQSFPAIYGNVIAWTDLRNGNADIYMWNGSVHQVTSNAAVQSRPAIYGNKIVYQDNRDSGRWHIYMWDGATETQITSGSGDQQAPSIYDNYVVYQDNRNGNWQIYIYEMDKHRETRVTNNAANQTIPKVYGNHIVYLDYRDSAFNIYMSTIS